MHQFPPPKARKFIATAADPAARRLAPQYHHIQVGLPTAQIGASPRLEHLCFECGRDCDLFRAGHGQFITGGRACISPCRLPKDFE
jgi:hypothetical protein